MITIMAWNVCGWLGFQVVYNQLHHHEETHYCTKSFCYCEVDGDQKICICHHQDEHMALGHHEEEPPPHTASFCHYSTPHNTPAATSISFISPELQALFVQTRLYRPVYYNNDLVRIIPLLQPQDVHSMLLRPPIA